MSLTELELCHKRQRWIRRRMEVRLRRYRRMGLRNGVSPYSPGRRMRSMLSGLGTVIRRAEYDKANTGPKAMISRAVAAVGRFFSRRGR